MMKKIACLLLLLGVWSGAAWAQATQDIGTNGSVQGCVKLESATASGSVNVCSPATSSAVTFTPPIGNGTNGQYLQSNGSGVTSWQTVSSGSSAPSTPQGRLTLTSAKPVMTADVTGATTIYYAAFRGNQVPVYNGTSDVGLAISNQSTTINSTQEVTTQVFDIWGINVSAALVICVATDGSGHGWASDTGGSNTARGTGYSQLDLTTRGYITNANSLSNCYNGSTNEASTPITANEATYLGSFYSTAGGQTEQVLQSAAASPATQGCLCLYNAYNQRVQTALVRDSSSTWTYNSSTWRAANGSASDSVVVLDGLQQSQVTARYAIPNSVAVGGSDCYIGVNLDTASATPTNVGRNETSAAATTPSVMTTFYPQIGIHTYIAAENGAGTNACSFTGGTTHGMALNVGMED